MILSVHVHTPTVDMQCCFTGDASCWYSLFEIGSAGIYCPVVNALGGKAVTTIHAVSTCQRHNMKILQLC